jgi:hypothetical protein
MKGLDVSGPPTIPKQFKIKPGGQSDVIVDSESDESDEDEDDLNRARVETSGDDEEKVEHCGDM